VNLFLGCVVYDDNIVLLSVSCFGLQKLIDVCEDYGGLWDSILLKVKLLPAFDLEITALAIFI